jgi:hypothetical protein
MILIEFAGQIYVILLREYSRYHNRSFGSGFIVLSPKNRTAAGLLQRAPETQQVCFTSAGSLLGSSKSALLRREVCWVFSGLSRHSRAIIFFDGMLKLCFSEGVEKNSCSPKISPRKISNVRLMMGRAAGGIIRN